MLGFPRLCWGNGEPAASVACVAWEGLPRGHRVVLCSQHVVDYSGWSAGDGDQRHCSAPSSILVNGPGHTCQRVRATEMRVIAADQTSVGTRSSGRVCKGKSSRTHNSGRRSRADNETVGLGNMTPTHLLGRHWEGVGGGTEGDTRGDGLEWSLRSCCEAVGLHGT